MMKLDQVIKRLENKLKNPLPGKEGQLRMAPKPLDEARFAKQKITNAREGGVMVLLYPGASGCMLPFIKRPEYDGTHGGQVSLPGGKREPEDIDIQYTAKRETEEEIGVFARDIQVIGQLSNLFIPPSNFLVTPFVGYVDYRPEFVPDPREVSRVIQCGFESLIDPQIRKERSIYVRDNLKLQAPYFDIDQEVVWGATAMILAELMAVWES